jgi:hypothetical protein
MEDLNGSASNADTIDVTPAPAPEAPAPVSTRREVLEKAFEKAGVVNRDEAGRFAPKADEPKADAPKAEKAAEAPAKPAEAAKPAAPAPEAPKPEAQPAAPVAAPTRFSPTAKALFEQAPPALQAEISRLEGELTKGLTEYQQRFEPIKRFDEMARAGGQSLDKVIESYVGMEDMLRKNPVQGFVAIAQNLGIDPRKIGEALTGVQGAQGGATPEVAALKAEIASLKSQVTGVVQTTHQSAIEAQIGEFQRAHPRFDELSDHIVKILASPYAAEGSPVERLAKAYEIAEKLSPAPPAPPAAQPAPVAVPPAPDAAQTRKAAGLSITGTPSPGSNPGLRKPAGSRREALTRAFAQVGIT